MCWPLRLFSPGPEKSSSIFFSLQEVHSLGFIHLPLFGIFKSMVREEEEE